MMEIIIPIVALVLTITAIYKYNSESGNKSNNETKVNRQDLKTVGKYMSDFEVVGVHVSWKKRHIVNYVSLHNPVTLIPEPKNKFSSKAIIVKVENVEVGYISQDDVDEVHEILKGPYLARVSYVDYTNGFVTLEIEVNHQ